MPDCGGHRKTLLWQSFLIAAVFLFDGKDKIMKKTISFILSFFLLTTAVYADIPYDTAAEAAAENIYETVKDPSVSSVGGEWAVLGLARSGADVPQTYYDKYLKNLGDYLSKKNGVLHDKKYTEYSRVVLALTALGKNPENFLGYNLLAPLGDYEKTVWQGTNGAVWALIALDSGDYEVPHNETAKTAATRGMYVENILSAQNNDGGFALSAGTESDIDITAMALAALSGYRTEEKVQNAVTAALGFVSANQGENGGFESYGAENAESAAQVLVALCGLGVDLHDGRFVKNGKTVLDNLMTFYDGKGGFCHAHGGDTNQMATEQAFYALTAVKRAKEGKTFLYDMSDVKRVQNADEDNAQGLPGKNAAVRAMPYIEYKTFADIEHHSARQKIEALAARGIINGKSAQSFDPDNTVTRAEYAAIITKGLGLWQEGKECFSDVLPADWYFDAVYTAYSYGIIKGVSDTEFNPSGRITKEEAAVMTSRAARLAGVEFAYEAQDIQNILAAFDDYREISGWAQEAVAFCCDKSIIPCEEMTINPKKPMSRAKIAEMVYNLLDKAKLLGEDE